MSDSSLYKPKGGRRATQQHKTSLFVGYVRIIILIISETLWKLRYHVFPSHNALAAAGSILASNERGCRVQTIWEMLWTGGGGLERYGRVPRGSQGDLMQCAGIVISVILFAYLGLKL